MNYKGYELKPIGNILGNFYNRAKVITRAYKLDIKDYHWVEFYKQAKKEHCNVDVFEYNGKYYIPCGDAICGLTDDFKKLLKPIDQYKVRYHTKEQLTKQGKLEYVYSKLENIYYFHNKNLTMKQFTEIGNCLTLLRELGVNK